MIRKKKANRSTAAEDALAALLREIVMIDIARRSEPVAGALMGTPLDLSSPIPTRDESFLSEVARRPIDAALRRAVRFVGEMLFVDLGDTDAMVEIAERVSTRSKGYSGRWLSIIDHAWDGIGAGQDYWWA